MKVIIGNCDGGWERLVFDDWRDAGGWWWGGGVELVVVVGYIYHSVCVVELASERKMSAKLEVNRK